LRSLEVFYFQKPSGLALVSQPQNRSAIFFRGTKLKDQHMKKIRSLAMAGLFALSVAPAFATTITENFANDPAADGWRVFGDTNLFQWDSTNHVLDVTWDSSQTNSYFYHPLGTIVTRDDDFSVSFDLQLNDIAGGNEPGKISPMELGFGFLNHADATDPSFERWLAGNLAELDYFPLGYYIDSQGKTNTIYPTLVPTFISSAYDYAPGSYSPYEVTLPTGVPVHASLTYTSGNQTLVTTFQTNGVDCAEIPPVVLTDNFTTDDNFAVDMFSISSYGSAGDPYDSVLAHGTVANLVVTVPPPPVQNLSGDFTNNLWQVQFTSRTNWLYTLQTTTNFQTWTDVSLAVSGSGTNLFLQDTNEPSDRAFYRVRADRP
jgi:hypothetical protein